MSSWRVGLGYDVHPLKEGRKLFLAGVHIPYELGLHGHSYGDVLCHARMDSLLGAAGLQDIGYWFPPTSPSTQGVRSTLLLEEVCKKIREKGWEIENVDTTLIAEQPLIAPFVGEMKKTLSLTMGVSEEAIGIKATTNEGLGSLGKGEGIGCFAVSLLRKKELTKF